MLPSTSGSSSTNSSPAHGDARPAKKRRADAAAPPQHAPHAPHAPHAQLGLVQQHHHQQGDLAGWYPAPSFDLPIDPHAARRDTIDSLPALASPHPSPYTAGITFPSSLVAPSPFEQPVHHWPAPAQQAPGEWTPNTPQSDAERTPSLLGADVTTSTSQLAWSHSLPPSPGAVEPISAESSPYPWFPWMPTVPPPVAGSPDQYSVSPFTPLGSIPTPPPPPFTAAVEPLPLVGFPLAPGNPAFSLPAGPTGYGHGGPSDVPAGYQVLAREAKEMMPFDRTIASEFQPPAAARFVADAVLEEHHPRPALGRSRPSADASALLQAIDLGRTYPVAVKQTDGREWIKPEPLDRAVWDASSYAPMPGQLLTTQPNLADNMPKVTRPSPEAATVSHVSALALRGPHPVVVKRADDKEWVKPEPLDRAGWDGRGFALVEAQPPPPPQPDAAEKVPTPGSEPDREPARNRKKPIRFDDERLRRETSNTRSMGACLRCHNQRVRVSHTILPQPPAPRR